MRHIPVLDELEFCSNMFEWWLGTVSGFYIRSHKGACLVCLCHGSLCVPPVEMLIDLYFKVLHASLNECPCNE